MATQTQASDGLLLNLGERIWDSIVTPGTSRGLLMVINMATLGMLICLLVMIFAGYGNIHVYILGGLGLGLLASVNWFVHEMWAFERSQDDQRGSADRVASGDEKKDKQS